MIKKWLISAALLFVALSFASASVVSFQIIQHDSSQKEVRASSYIIEDVLFDYFFNKGIVVTNSPTAISEDETYDKALYYSSLSDATEGGCSHFVVITTDYDIARSTNPAAMILSNITEVNWILFDAQNGKQLASGKKKVGTVPDRRDNENGIASFARELAAEICAHIK